MKEIESEKLEEEDEEGEVNKTESEWRKMKKGDKKILKLVSVFNHFKRHEYHMCTYLRVCLGSKTTTIPAIERRAVWCPCITFGCGIAVNFLQQINDACWIRQSAILCLSIRINDVDRLQQQF